MGAADYLQKPIVSFDLLAHALSAVLERARLARAVTLAQGRYASLVQNLPLLVFVLRPDFELEFINTACHPMANAGSRMTRTPNGTDTGASGPPRKRIRS